MKNLRKNKKGFTLIEIIVVLVILGILMAIAVPSVMKYIDEADNAKYLAEARAVYTSADVEIAKDYADDKKLNGSSWELEDGTSSTDFAAVLKDASTVEVTGIEVYAGSTKVDFKTDNTVTPKDVDKYVITIGDDNTKVQITRNGEAKIVK